MIETQKISIKLRLLSMLLDHFFICFITIPPIVLLDHLLPVRTLDNYWFPLIFIIYLNKDFAKGKSIAKRILGLRIVDHKTGETANEWQCFLRNIFTMLWPIEVLFTLFSPTRKIGDYLASTHIRRSKEEKIFSIITDMKEFRMSITTLWLVISSIGYGILVYFISQFL